MSPVDAAGAAVREVGKAGCGERPCGSLHTALTLLPAELAGEMSDADVARVMARLDTSGDGTVSYDEFRVFWELNLNVEALLDCDVAALVRGDVQRARLRVQRG